MSYFYARAKEQAAAPYGGVETAEGRKAAEAVDARQVPPRRPEAAVAGGRDHHARGLGGGVGPVALLARRAGDPGDGLAGSSRSGSPTTSSTSAT